MKLSGTYTIEAPPDRVFAALTDPAVLQRVIPGCEDIVRTGDGTYEAVLKVGIASLKGTYKGKVRLDELQPPHSYRMQVEGKGTPGFVNGFARMRLAPQGSATVVSSDADVQVGGLIAAVGSRLLEATARRMMDQFFRDFAAELRAT